MKRIRLDVTPVTQKPDRVHYSWQVWLGGGTYARFTSRRTAQAWAAEASDELTFRFHEAGFIWRELADLTRSIWILADTRTRITPGYVNHMESRLVEFRSQMDRILDGSLTYDPVTKMIRWYDHMQAMPTLLLEVFRYRSDTERIYRIRSIQWRLTSGARAIREMRQLCPYSTLPTANVPGVN